MCDRMAGYVYDEVLEMSERFSFINEIEDEAFLYYFCEAGRSLYDQCTDLEADCARRPDTCIREGRALSEKVMKYLYYRLYGHKWKGKAYKLLDHIGFQKKVNNRTLIDMAQRIRVDGNAQVHADVADQNKYDLKQTSENILNSLPYIINKSYEIMKDADESWKEIHKEIQKEGTIGQTQVREKNSFEKSNSGKAESDETESGETESGETESVQNVTVPSFVRYFVRPDDYFALHSLELVTADVYLYRLLKNSRFTYVCFVEREETGYVVYTYDRESDTVFSKTDSTSEKKKGLLGRRPVCRFPADVQGYMRLVNMVRNALSSGEYKSAVVMPLKILEESGCRTDFFADLSGSFKKDREPGHLLLFTLTDKKELYACVQNRQYQWMQEPEQLLKCGRLVAADTYGTDEFANLLFRKILIENNRGLAGMGITKVYTAAESLHDYFMNADTMETYQNLKKGRGSILKELDRQLDRENVIQELVEKALTRDAVRIINTQPLHALQVERVYPGRCNRPEHAVLSG